MITGNIKQIETMGLVDGPGIRIVVFMGGCPLRCTFCHNPEMWEKAEDNYTPEKVLHFILKYKNYIGVSGGVTFSGGEPLFQPTFLIECLKLCKQHHLHTCLDTSGSCNPAFFDEILQYTDLVIMDIKALDAINYTKITNGNIENSLAFFEACQKNKKKLWIRQVIVPGINDSIEYINNLASFINKLQYVERVELLPYHTMSLTKYKNLNIKYNLDHVPPMDIKKCKELEVELHHLLNLPNKPIIEQEVH